MSKGIRIYGLRLRVKALQTAARMLKDDFCNDGDIAINCTVNMQVA